MIKKILRIKFIPALLVFLIVATPVSANEIIRLNQFNNYLKQAQDLNASEKPQEAQEALQQAKEKIYTTLLVKALKNEKIKQTEKEIEEIRRLVDKKVKENAVIENLPTPIETTTSPSNNSPTGLNQNSYPISNPQPTATPPRPTLTKIDWEQFNRELNESLKEVGGVDDDNSNGSIEPTLSIEQQKAAKIISISDSLGNTFETNCQWSTTHYECPPKEQKEPTVSIKTTPQLTFTINAQDPNNRPLVSNFYFQEGCNGNTEFVPWLPTNICTLTLKTNELGVRNFSFYVKNDDNYGSVGLDANTALHYRITE